MNHGIIYIAGNPQLRSDNKPYIFIEGLKKEFPKINFVFFDPTDELIHDDNKLVLIDTIVGIKNVTLFDNLKDFEKPPRNTVHDFDLYWQLGLMLKLKKINQINIIGLPQIIKEEKTTLKNLNSIISSI